MVLALASTTCLHAKAQASSFAQRRLQAAAAALAGELHAVEAGLRALADGRPLQATSEEGAPACDTTAASVRCGSEAYWELPRCACEYDAYKMLKRRSFFLLGSWVMMLVQGWRPCVSLLV